MLSIPKQTRAFVDRVRQFSEQSGEKIYEFQQLQEIAKSLNLQAGDFRTFIDKLNANGIMIKKSNN
jgi:ABC-type transporter Mla subunit MlaD